MFDHIQSPSLIACSDPAASLRLFFANHREGVVHAADLLGGRRGRRMACDLLEDLASGRSISRRTWAQLSALLELFSLEHVHEFGTEECSRFASIDPSDPVVEKICVLTDGLRDALERATTTELPVSRRAPA